MRNSAAAVMELPPTPGRGRNRLQNFILRKDHPEPPRTPQDGGEGARTAKSSGVYVVALWMDMKNVAWVSLLPPVLLTFGAIYPGPRAIEFPPVV